MMAPVGQAHAIKRIFGCATSLRARNARIDQRQFNILQRTRPRQEGRQLEDKTNVFVPDARECLLAKLQRPGPLAHISRIWSLQKTQKVHQRRLTRTRPAANGNKLTVLDRERHIGYRANYGRPEGKYFDIPTIWTNGAISKSQANAEIPSLVLGVGN
jgi:hypothetical protein